jgi:hypothetical protein
MDQFLDWFDANAVQVLSPHAWVWASVTAVAAVAALIAIANIGRYYGRLGIQAEE